MTATPSPPPSTKFGPFRVGPWRAVWVWLARDPSVGAPGRVGAVPCAVQIDHGDHQLVVPWVPVDGAPVVAFTPTSLLPLTVVEPVTCVVCQVTGRIEAGAWVPTEGGERG